VIIARSIGDTPSQNEKLLNERNINITTPIEERNPTTIATRSIIPIPTISIFGGPRYSSVSRLISLRTLSFSDIVYKKNEAGTNTDKYIRKIQNSKVFYRYKINYKSIEYSFISMRKCSSKNQRISDIKKSYIFWVFCYKIIKKYTNNEKYSDYLEGNSFYRKGKCNSSIV